MPVDPEHDEQEQELKRQREQDEINPEDAGRVPPWEDYRNSPEYLGGFVD